MVMIRDARRFIRTQSGSLSSVALVTGARHWIALSYSLVTNSSRQNPILLAFALLTQAGYPRLSVAPMCHLQG